MCMCIMCECHEIRIYAEIFIQIPYVYLYKTLQILCVHIYTLYFIYIHTILMLHI